MNVTFYPIAPVPAPRQVARDKFKPSPAVQRYRAFRDEVGWRRVTIPLPYYHVIFLIEIPGSWSEKKKRAHILQPHQQTPDRDNLEKALLDAVFGQDSHIWDGRTTKLWCPYPGILISDEDLPSPDYIRQFMPEIP